jgi:hypothetical protein
MNRNLPKDDKLIKNIVILSQYFEVKDGILYYIWVLQKERKKEEVRRQIVLPLDWKYKAL